MTKYRQVQVSFWQDGFVLDLTPEEKYFYIYLMTNSKASQTGIYELPKRIIETETGYNRETVDKLLHRFIGYGKVEYHEPTKEIMLKNWVKHNWNNSPKVIARVEQELSEIKHTPFALEYLESVDTIKADTVSIQYAYSMDTKDKDKDKEKDKDNKIAQEAPVIDLEFEFDEFYKIYKKKVDRKRAFASFKTARKKNSFEDIMSGTVKYMAYCEAMKTDSKYIKGPAVFLNGENFKDDYQGIMPAKGNGTNGHAGNSDAAYARTLDENGQPVEYSFD